MLRTAYWPGLFVLAVLLSWPAVVVHAFNPPVDRAGTLTARIEGPAEVKRLDLPIPIRVVLENTGQREIRGTLRLSGIDRWRCRPAAAVPFLVHGGGKVSNDFQVTAGQGTYSAHYPIHAFATFRQDGKRQTAHPILVLQTRVPPMGQPSAPRAWRPFVLSPNRRLTLSSLPVRRTVVSVFNQPPKTMPVGWSGVVPGCRASFDVQPVQIGDSRRSALVIHPPWDRGQVGTIWVEYPLALPTTKPIQLRFATAVTATGHGDGVTFRVRVAPLGAPDSAAGSVIFQRHSAAKTWQPATVDLSRFAGQKIRLQLESHPGPKRNTGWDLSFWAEPLLVAGTPPKPPPFPPVAWQDARRLGTIRCGTEMCDVRVRPGSRGLLDADVALIAGNRRLCFRGFQVRVLGSALEDPASPVTLLRAEQQPATGGYCVRHAFTSPWGPFELVGRMTVNGSALQVHFELEQSPAQRPWFAPRIERVAVGPMSERATRVYAGQGNVLVRPTAFRLGFDGHRLATSYVGFDFPCGLALVEAVDNPPEALVVDPAKRHFSLPATGNATIRFIPADNVWQAVKIYRRTCGRRQVPSAKWNRVAEDGAGAARPGKTFRTASGVRKLAGRFVFDLWGGRYRDATRQLQRAFRYGLTDAAVVWHNWQRWGYDYRLPEIYPPNPRWGTPEDLKTLIAVCRQAGVLVALHDNYIDMYPDATGFSYEKNIAFRDAATPQRAWLNRGRQAQSYRYRADRVEAFLRPNLQVIRDRLQPTAYFIDVWSSARPYDYWTADGRFFDCCFTRDVWRRQFAWIRHALGDQAPQISESGHDQLVGWLDGAQANHLRAGPPPAGSKTWMVWNLRCQDTERIPWLDAAYHDRFVLHGAGYPGRYEGGLDPRLHGITSDDYLATEVLTGHPAMVSRPFGRDVVRAYWLTHGLMRALALRTIEDVQFVGGNIHRQHVRWSGGGNVWVNRGAEDWNVAGHRLPEFGFFARVTVRGGTVTAAVSRRQAMIVEMAQSPDHFYCNGRQVAARHVPGRHVPSTHTKPSGEKIEAAWQARHNPAGKAIDFGPVVTAGGCQLTRDGNGLRVTPLPAGKTAETIVQIRWNRLPWPLPQPTHVETLAEDGHVLARKPVAKDLRLRCRRGAFAYRLRAGP